MARRITGGRFGDVGGGLGFIRRASTGLCDFQRGTIADGGLGGLRIRQRLLDRGLTHLDYRPYGTMALPTDDPPRLMATTDASVIRFAQRATVRSSESAGAGRDVHQSIRQRQCRLRSTLYGPAQNDADWHAYGSGKPALAPFEAINADNVNQLQRAWEIRTGVPGRFSGTPLQIGDGIYLCTAQNVMISLDPDSGEERWRFDPENETPPYSLFGNCRGVTYYELEDVADGAQCKERIFTATTDARLIAVDKDTGLPCEDFGKDGQISLLAGMGEVKPYYYFVTSPATVASGVLVVGGWVMDNQEVEEPSGVVRAYDPKTGKLAWAWDIGREGNTQLPPEGESYTRGTPNVWSLTSADDELGLVYLPTGNATPDYFGAHRSEAMEKYASSIVAVDATTGLTRWHFQTTHHDIWDYDVPSQPTLVDLTLDGQRRKAVIVPTKRGEVFMLDRETGELLTEVTERPVPQTDLENEWSAPTQPFSTGMPSFAYPLITESKMMGVTPFDQIACRKALLDLRYEGPMTPPSERGTMYLRPAGGMNWGSVAVDERRQLMVVNNCRLSLLTDSSRARSGDRR